MPMKRLVSVLLALVFLPVLAQDRTQVLVYGGDFTDLITLDPQVVYEFSGVMRSCKHLCVGVRV
jgi:peptide/nickel transport system substrate-binding protein